MGLLVGSALGKKLTTESSWNQRRARKVFLFLYGASVLLMPVIAFFIQTAAARKVDILVHGFPVVLDHGTGVPAHDELVLDVEYGDATKGENVLDDADPSTSPSLAIWFTRVR